MRRDTTPGETRLLRQIEFIVEIDRLKSVLRRTLIMDESRRENSAEHSWHLAVMALVLHEHAPEDVDLARVLKMVLVHDLVEIDAGDTFCYDEQANEGRLQRERRAADRLFGLLPEDLGSELDRLWREFEAGETADARFAAALDRMQPLLSNLETGGHSWLANDVDHAQVVERTSRIGDASPTLWDYMRKRLEKAVDEGILKA